MREIDAVNDNLEVIELIKQIERFDFMSESELCALITSCKLKEFKVGEIVINEGEYDCWVYFLISGALEIKKGDKALGRLQRNGDIFGEMGVIDGSPRSATIAAISATKVLGIDASLIDQKLKTSEVTFCYLIYRLFAEVLAARLRETTEENLQLRKALAKFGVS